MNQITCKFSVSFNIFFKITAKKFSERKEKVKQSYPLNNFTSLNKYVLKYGREIIQWVVESAPVQLILPWMTRKSNFARFFLILQQTTVKLVGSLQKLFYCSVLAKNFNLVRFLAHFVNITVIYLENTVFLARILQDY